MKSGTHVVVIQIMEQFQVDLLHVKDDNSEDRKWQQDFAFDVLAMMGYCFHDQSQHHFFYKRPVPGGFWHAVHVSHYT